MKMNTAHDTTKTSSSTNVSLINSAGDDGSIKVKNGSAAEGASSSSSNIDTRCALCGVAATQACSDCLQVHYCSRDHQRKHWKQEHKDRCLPYKVETWPVTGRTLVARRAIQPGEVISSELPLVLGPKQLSDSMCVGCHSSMPANKQQGGAAADDELDDHDQSHQRCSWHYCGSCGWPLCSPSCEKSPFHKPECELISTWQRNAAVSVLGKGAGAEATSRIKRTVNMERMVNTRGIYGCICILRCLWLREKAGRVDSAAAARITVEKADNCCRQQVVAETCCKRKWEAIASMQSNVEERRRRHPQLWALNQRNVVDFIRSYLMMGLVTGASVGSDTSCTGMASEDESLIHHLCGIWDTNAFEIRHHQQQQGTVMRSSAAVRLRGLFKMASFMAHDCRANTKHCFERASATASSECADRTSSAAESDAADGHRFIDYRMVVRATVPIARGEAITTCYTQPLSNTMARRAHLDFAKHFRCTCRRCSDPTELRTYLTAWKCQRPSCNNNNNNSSHDTNGDRRANKNGTAVAERRVATMSYRGGRLVATNADDPDGLWICDKCNNRVPANVVKAMEQKVNTAFAKLGRTVEDLEAFLVEFDSVLLPSTSYAVQAKYTLVQLLPLDEGNEQDVRRKEELSRELLHLMDVLSPGLSRVRGFLLHHLYVSLRLRVLQQQQQQRTQPASSTMTAGIISDGNCAGDEASPAPAATAVEGGRAEARSTKKRNRRGQQGKRPSRQQLQQESGTADGSINNNKDHQLLAEAKRCLLEAMVILKHEPTNPIISSNAPTNAGGIGIREAAQGGPTIKGGHGSGASCISSSAHGGDQHHDRLDQELEELEKMILECSLSSCDQS